MDENRIGRKALDQNRLDENRLDENWAHVMQHIIIIFDSKFAVAQKLGTRPKPPAFNISAPLILDKFGMKVHLVGSLCSKCFFFIKILNLGKLNDQLKSRKISTSIIMLRCRQNFLCNFSVCTVLQHQC